MTSKSCPLRSGDDFLKSLFEGERTFRFKSKPGLERILQDINLLQNKYLVFTDVSVNTFEELSTNSSSLLYRKTKTYLHDTKQLIINMPSSAYEALASRFNYILTSKISAIGADVKFRSVGSADAVMGNVTKEADGSWGPYKDDIHYVTGVLEVGYSNSMSKLATVAHLWLEKKESHVRQVVTAKISLDKPKIVFQKWELVERRYTTRAHYPPQAEVIEEINVEKKNNKVEVQGSLHLSYAKILEEPAPPGTSDDIELGLEDLTTIAERTWYEQTFTEPQEGSGGTEVVAGHSA